MPWETFKPSRTSSKPYPTMSIWSNGHIAWNKFADEKLGSPVYVHVLFDKDKKRLGLRAAGDGGNGSFKVQRPKSSTSYSIDSRRVVRGELGIKLEKAVRQEAQLDGDILYIQVGELIKEG